MTRALLELLAAGLLLAAPAELGARAAHLAGFDRLPGTRLEAKAIASRALATGQALAGHRIARLATHGVLESRRPEPSGLVLSLLDERGAPHDGFLRPQDVLGMSLLQGRLAMTGGLASITTLLLASTTPGPRAAALSPRAPVKVVLAPGAARSFTFVAGEGQLVHVEVEQAASSPVSARLEPPDGGEPVEVGNPRHEPEALPLSAVSRAPGAWRLTLRLDPGAARPGRFVVTLDAPRPAVPADAARVAAERAYAEGQRLMADAKRDRKLLPEAIAADERAARLAAEAGDVRREGWACFALGEAHMTQGELARAVEDMGRALERFRAAHDDRGVVEALSDRGAFELEAGDPQFMLDAAPEALAAARRLGDLENEGTVLHNLGVARLAVAEYAAARQALLRALGVRRRLGDRSGQANTLDTLASVDQKSGDPRPAERLLRRALRLRHQAGDRGREAATLWKLGQVQQELGRHDEALVTLRRAVDLAHAGGRRTTEAIATDLEGHSLHALGRLDEALATHRRALAMATEWGSRHARARALRGIATDLRDLGRLDEARRAAEESVQLAESVEEGIAGPDRRAGYLSAMHDHYAVLVDVLERLHRRDHDLAPAAAALEVSERAHARGLLELLGEARVDLRRGVDPPLLDRERAAAKAFDAASARQARLLAAGDPDPAAVAQAAADVAARARELDEARELIRSHSPRYADLVHPRPLDAAAIARELGGDALLLEYLVGDEQSFLWALGEDGLTLHVLPGRAALEALVRRVRDRWTGASPGDDEPRVAARAAETLLGPVAGRLGRRRLVVVADGALHYLPFAALPLPGRGGRAVLDHEVVTLPSASSLSALRARASERSPAPRAVAVLADPVFDARDERVRGGAAPSRVARELLRRSGSDVGLAGFERLRGTRREADAIAGLVPADEALLALDFRASRATATGEALGGYRIVHFATHGLLDSRRPELSGLVLSLVDEAGRPQNGFLRLGDVFGMSLRADLVVLSACQTALGKEIRGEGLLGLTRGFMYAGAPRIVASLWRVPDGPTYELMRRFYAAMLTEGLPAAAALRKAQAALAAGGRWSAPTYWAGFALQGDWR